MRLRAALVEACDLAERLARDYASPGAATAIMVETTRLRRVAGEAGE